MKKAYAELIQKQRAGEYVSDEDEYIADNDGNLNGEGNIITPRRKGRMVRSLTDTSECCDAQVDSALMVNADVSRCQSCQESG